MLKIIFNQLNFGQNKKKFSIFQKILIFLIILSSLIVIIETEKEIYNSYNSFFEFCKYFFGVIFLIEYIFRVLSAGYIKKYKGLSGRIKYILSFWTLIDLIAIIPFFLSGINETFLLRLLRLIRLFSVIRIGRYSTALKNVLEAISDRKHELLFAVAISTTVLIISSTFMYLLEAEKQPEVFGSIIRSVWWAAAALTTVGYGDVYPITIGGKIFTFFVLMIGIGIVAVPAGLVGTALSKARELEKK